MREAVNALAHPTLHQFSQLQVQAAIKSGATDVMLHIHRRPEGMKWLQETFDKAMGEHLVAGPHVIAFAAALLAKTANSMAKQDAEMTGLPVVGMQRLMIGIASYVLADLSDKMMSDNVGASE